MTLKEALLEEGIHIADLFEEEQLERMQIGFGAAGLTLSAALRTVQSLADNQAVRVIKDKLEDVVAHFKQVVADAQDYCDYDEPLHPWKHMSRGEWLRHNAAAMNKHFSRAQHAHNGRHPRYIRAIRL